jgi:arylsulfatase A-like enzyme
MAAKKRKPNFLIVLIDDLRFDELGICGHPYMKTPNIDRIGHEGAMFNAAFHTTPLCSPNRASILTGQYASRHGIIDNVARDAHSHRLPNYHVILQRLGYETAHVGKWHMGNSGGPRPGYDRWVSFPGHGSILDPVLNIDGKERQHKGYITDLLNKHAVEFLRQERDKPFALFFAHKAVHPDAYQAADGTIDFRNGGYLPAARHADLYKGEHFPRRPNAVAPSEVVKQKPAWTEAHALRTNAASRKLLDGMQAGTEEEIRLRAAMMASVDEGMADVFKALEETGELDNTFILFLGDNGYFFGEHGLGPERRFAYEEGIRSPFLIRYPAWFKPGTVNDDLVLALDIAPTVLDLAGAKGDDFEHIQGLSLKPLSKSGSKRGWRTSFMCEYFSENAMPWLIGMSYKAIRTKRHKYIHWTQKSLNGVECDELYDLKSDPYEMKNLLGQRGAGPLIARLRRQLAQLVANSVGL